VPGKNIRTVAGRPLLAWTVAAAQGCSSVQRIVVTTDDPEIAAVARQCGAEVPFMRPAELAQDDTPTVAAVLHAAQWLEAHGYIPEWIVVLQPTSPLRTASDIGAALALAVARDADSVISVCPVKHHPYWAMSLDADGMLGNFLGLDLMEMDARYPRRQDLPPSYAENGAIYLVRRTALLARRSLYAERTYGLVMPFERSLDLDSGMDLQIAASLLEDRPWAS
jgi:N-acylneuraminate cytidylyltransferase/CMP-N,N'-diacetyllegionaminic acid synthase